MGFMIRTARRRNNELNVAVRKGIEPEMANASLNHSVRLTHRLVNYGRGNAVSVWPTAVFGPHGIVRAAGPVLTE